MDWKSIVVEVPGSDELVKSIEEIVESEVHQRLRQVVEEIAKGERINKAYLLETYCKKKPLSSS